jgi:hypothetical protein
VIPTITKIRPPSSTFLPKRNPSSSHHRGSPAIHLFYGIILLTLSIHQSARPSAFPDSDARASSPAPRLSVDSQQPLPSSAMRKQPIQTSSNTNPIYPSEHPNASKRIPYFMQNSQASASAPNHVGPPHLPNGNGNGNGNVNGINNGNGNGQTQPEDPVANYTLQGVMQWLNGEYRRYERERNTWEIERASLVVWHGPMELTIGSSIAFDGDKSRLTESAG